MSYRNILVNLNVEGPVAPLIDFSIHLAARFNAHLIAFAVAAPTPPLRSFESLAVDAEMVRQGREESRPA